MWLNTVPEGQPESREDQGIELTLPEIDGGEDLVNHLHSIGFAKQTAMGCESITWQELESWDKQMGHNLNPWELETLKKMSDSYVRMAVKASKPDCPSPDYSEDDYERAKRVEDLLFS